MRCCAHPVQVLGPDTQRVVGDVPNVRFLDRPSPIDSYLQPGRNVVFPFIELPVEFLDRPGLQGRHLPPAQRVIVALVACASGPPPVQDPLTGLGENLFTVFINKFDVDGLAGQ